MGFIMDGLDAEAYDRKYTDRALVQRIISYFRPERGRLGIVMLAIAAGSLVNTIIPIVISDGIDRLQTDNTTAMVTAIIVGLVVFGLLSWAFNAARQWLATAAVANVTLKIRQDAFDAVMQRDLSFYDEFASGKIVSRVTSDSQAFSSVVNLVTDLGSQILIVTLLTGYLFTVSVPMTLMTLAISPFIIITALAFRHIARHTVTQSRRVNAVVSSHIQETISGIGIAKTFRQEQTIYDEFLDVNRQSFRVNLRTGVTFSSIFPILIAIASFGTGALIYFGGVAAQNGDITSGEWYLFIQGISLFWFPLTSIASFWSQFQLGLAAGERVFALIDAEPKVVQTGENVVLAQPRGEITFEHVDFRYTTNEPVLTDFSLHIKAGETLALVGHTGSGKSSIGKLIARFYEYQDGRILIDGHDIRSLDLAAYRARLGIVTQTPFLFDGTVRENLRYGAPESTDADVERIANLIGDGDWLRSLPDGLNTPVGERGSSLSMGQRQLVALGRVLLQNPAICILDEATASVDPLTETFIQEGLDAVLEGRTSIVIAHRLSTIKNADRIIVLREGAIIEQGTHDSLMADGGHYAELYNTYFRHQSLDYLEAQAV
ncbi:MAG: ABC transporter ATP-binding protein [Chloroflexota bacterium]|nr:ABC transporter ATP-binding protein [Chloroflexota bacterium]